MAKKADWEAKEVAVQIKRITGHKTAYGNDSFDAIGVTGPFVRVDIGSTGRKSFNRKVIETRNAILKILDRFYKKHASTDLGSRLILRSIGIYGDFLIASQNADIIAGSSSPIKEKLLKKHAKEFAELAKFLEKTSV